MDNFGVRWRTTKIASAIIAIGTFLPGCHTLAVNPFVDELADRPAVTTASVDGIRASDASTIDRRRPHAAAQVAPVDGKVTHGPLYFEDFPVDLEEADGRFAWTAADLWYGYYGAGRFLVNATFFPVSAVIAPPWTVMCSNGQAGRTAWGMEHDAVRCTP